MFFHWCTQQNVLYCLHSKLRRYNNREISQTRCKLYTRLLGQSKMDQKRTSCQNVMNVTKINKTSLPFNRKEMYYCKKKWSIAE